MSSIPSFRADVSGESASWLDAIPDGPFRFRVGTRPGDALGYFAPTEAHHDILAERRRWLQSNPQRYAALLPEGTAVLDAVVQLFARWPSSDGAAMTSTVTSTAISLPADAAPWERLMALGRSWEPDFALLRRDAAGRMVLVGGCVCFPTNWRLTDKIGYPLGQVHDIVPGLNSSIGAPIDTFLSRMKPDSCWTRSNWGMARSTERNQHPDLGLPALDEGCAMEEVWLRIEDQALVSLGEVAGRLFGIRVRHVSLRDVLRNAIASERLGRAIETMSPEMLHYKNLSAIRDRLLDWLRGPVE